jgi:hypothetical protein
MDNPPVRFPCPKCHTLLTVPASMRHVTGPCPHCGEIISSPMPPLRIKPTANRKRRHVIPDATVNFSHQQNRESWITLRILGLFLLAAAICYVTLKYMQALGAD